MHRKRLSQHASTELGSLSCLIALKQSNTHMFVKNTQATKTVMSVKVNNWEINCMLMHGGLCVAHLVLYNTAVSVNSYGRGL